MTTLALAFAFLWVRLVGKKKKLEEDACEVKVKDAKTGESKTEKISLYEHDVREFRKVLTSNIMGGIPGIRKDLSRGIRQNLDIL